MVAAWVRLDFELELKKRSFLATILDKNSYTFNWILIVGLYNIKIRKSIRAWFHSRKSCRSALYQQARWSLVLGLLAINFDERREKKLQLTIPDIFWAQHKPSHHGRASKDYSQTKSSLSMLCPIGKRPALKSQVPIMYCVTTMQRYVDSDVCFTQHCRADLM